MRAFSLSSWVALASIFTTALSTSPRFPLRRGGGGGGPSCAHASLDTSPPQTVYTLVSTYAQLIGNYSDALGQSFLADNFSDTSASINVLAGIDLTAVTFPTKAAFMASQETQPKIPLVVSSINAVTHDDVVVIRWTQTFGEANKPVAGISILDFVCQSGVWKLGKLFAEFNTAVYFEDAGGSCTY